MAERHAILISTSVHGQVAFSNSFIYYLLYLKCTIMEFPSTSCAELNLFASKVIKVYAGSTDSQNGLETQLTDKIDCRGLSYDQLLSLRSKSILFPFFSSSCRRSVYGYRSVYCSRSRSRYRYFLATLINSKRFGETGVTFCN